MKKIALIGLTCLSMSLVLSSCSKDRNKRIRIKETIIPIKADLNQKYEIKGLETDYILIGGKWYDIDEEVKNTCLYPFPMAIEGSNHIYLRTGVKYKNEFYVMTRTLKKDAECMTQDINGEIINSKFKAGKKISFIWSTKDGFNGWYKWFEIFEFVDPIKSGEKLQIMVIAENTTKSQIQNTDNVKGKTNAFYLHPDGTRDDIAPNSTDQPLVFESKQKIAICEEFTYNGPGKYNLKTSIFDNEVVIDEQELTSENLGIK